MCMSEIEMVEDLIKGYGGDITLGELLDNLKLMALVKGD